MTSEIGPSKRMMLGALLLLALAACSVAPAGRSDVDEDGDTLSALNGATCGKERWSVKTGTDPDAPSVSLSPSNTTLNALITAARPGTIPADNRLSPEETTLWKLTDVTLVQFKQEGDSDYHLVLSDGTNTMIAEIPDPGCVGSGSPFSQAIQAVRAAFDAKFTVSGSFQSAGIPVTLVGAGFFDMMHGQTGVAPNGLELHPVLGICFGAGCSLGGGGGTDDFSVAVNPSSVSANAGGTVNFGVSTAVVSGNAQNVTLSASGLPAGVTVSFSPSQVQAGGTSTATLSVPAGTASGTYSFTVNGQGSSTSHNATESLTVGAVPVTSVAFEVDNATTFWGQNVYVVGDAAELGAWDTTKAVALSPTAYPNWTGSVTLVAGATIQFKFIKIDPSGNVTWESGANRTTTVPTTGTGNYTETWY